MDQIKISRKLLSDMADLSLQGTNSIPVFKKLPRPKSGMMKLLDSHGKNSLRFGSFDYLYKKDKLQAYFMTTQGELAPGLKVTFAVVNAKKNKTAKAWVQKRLDECSAFFQGRVMFEVPVHLKDWMPMFNEAGFSIETMKLIGLPGDCLRKFDKHSKGFVSPEKMSLKVEEADLDDLKAARDLESQEFTRNPQFGWFVHTDAWLDQSLNRRINVLESKQGTNYVFKNKKGKVIGFFGYDFFDTPNFGRLAGSELIFDESIQGKGLSKIAYKMLLEDMVKSKSRYISGNTAQPGVLKNCRSMGRYPMSFSLINEKGHFDNDHFLQFT